MVSNDAIRPRLANFVCVRLGWEAMQEAKRRHGLVGAMQGNQVLLDPSGEYIEGIESSGRRYQIDELAALLDRLHARYPGHATRRNELKLDWFYIDRFAPPAPGQLSGSFVSRVDRKPLAIVEGEDAALLTQSQFLRRHVREFIWERGSRDGPPRIVVRRFTPTRTDLATIDLSSGDSERVSGQLDSAWLAYMQERPMVALDYLDSPNCSWCMEAHLEEVQVREEATAGTLQPPGRK